MSPTQGATNAALAETLAPLPQPVQDITRSAGTLADDPKPDHDPTIDVPPKESHDLKEPDNFSKELSASAEVSPVEGLSKESSSFANLADTLLQTKPCSTGELNLVKRKATCSPTLSGLNFVNDSSDEEPQPTAPLMPKKKQKLNAGDYLEVSSDEDNSTLTLRKHTSDVKGQSSNKDNILQGKPKETHRSRGKLHEHEEHTIPVSKSRSENSVYRVDYDKLSFEDQESWKRTFTHAIDMALIVFVIV